MALKPLLPSAIKYLAVHCSATSPKVFVDAKAIDRWHRQRGWLKIGYHFVILRDGTVEQGRALNEVGAHVEGFNSQSLGICLAGGVDASNKPVNNFTSEQFHSLTKLLQDLSVKFPAAVVQGHRDFPRVKKECPCFDVKPWWASVKDK
jgi:N-acetylmuramoyl-L-alanine amidase